MVSSLTAASRRSRVRGCRVRVHGSLKSNARTIGNQAEIRESSRQLLQELQPALELSGPVTVADSVTVVR
jgi:hypothetical protein